jgi:hypothetical protein
VNNTAKPAHCTTTTAGDPDSPLRSLAENLRNHGLTAILVSYLTDGVRNKHYDAINVTNPASPERGTLHIEKDGMITWEYPGPGSLDNTAIATIANEAASTLDAAGPPTAATRATAPTTP